MIGLASANLIVITAFASVAAFGLMIYIAFFKEKTSPQRKKSSK